jgi:ElaB/YqjD/DUF883 family membrane-anchored ribosome-binding protein
MAENIAEIETELQEARHELSQSVTAMSEKVAATRAELYAPAVSISIAIATGVGFMIGSRRSHPFTPLVFAAAGYCAVELLRRSRRKP